MEEAVCSINEAQDAVVEEFRSLDDPLSEYELLLEYAATLPKLDEAHMVDENLVRGCQSSVWLVLGCEGGRLSVAADSDTLIIRGILHLLEKILGGQKLEDVASAQLYFLDAADLMATFNDTRRKGIGTAIKNIQAYAAEHAGAGA